MNFIVKQPLFPVKTTRFSISCVKLSCSNVNHKFITQALFPCSAAAVFLWRNNKISSGATTV